MTLGPVSSGTQVSAQGRLVARWIWAPCQAGPVLAGLLSPLQPPGSWPVFTSACSWSGYWFSSCLNKGTSILRIITIRIAVALDCRHAAFPVVGFNVRIIPCVNSQLLPMVCSLFQIKETLFDFCCWVLLLSPVSKACHSDSNRDEGKRVQVRFHRLEVPFSVGVIMATPFCLLDILSFLKTKTPMSNPKPTSQGMWHVMLVFYLKTH